MLRRRYFVVSGEGPALDGYLGASTPGWSVSSGYSSWIDYDRNVSTVEGGVAAVRGGQWEKILAADTMHVALNIHAVAPEAYQP